MSDLDNDELVAQFSQITGVQPAEALEYLTAHQFDMQSAMADFFTDPPRPSSSEKMDSEDSGDERMKNQSTSAQPSQASGGGRRLGDGTEGAQPALATSSSSSSLQSGRSSSRKQAPQKKKFATLGDISTGGHEGHGHASNDSSDDENKQDLFAGGEKSGLALQNPDDLKKKILEKAKRAQRRPEEDPKPRPSHFTGVARTLGGDDAPSQLIEPPQPIPGMQRPPRVERILHFWSDGFSIDDGPLFRSDDPANRRILEGIRRGAAPLSIMNVMPGQEVDVEIQQHSEAYVQPKKKYKPFEGHGHRLGSPTPGASSSSAASASAAPPTSSSSMEPAKVEIDESQPTVTLQIRLGDGSRLSSRFNTTHTIGDVYSFVAAASPASLNRSWVLMTTFPNKDLTDKAAVLGDMPDFKRGGAVVQKWI